MLPRALGLIVGWAASAMLACAPPAVPTAQPNIVLILSDDHNWRDYSFTGENPYVSTPHIDQLAAEGVLYSRAYVPTSLCRPSIATLFTGLHAATTGVTGNEPAPTGSRENDALAQAIVRRSVALEATLPRILREVGYRTLQTGKWWEGDFERAGFDDGLVRDRHKALAGTRSRTIGRGGLGPIERFIGRAATDGVQFFVSYAPMLPHVPHNAPRRLRERYDPLVERGEITQNEAVYYAAVDWFDETVGALRELLRTTQGADGRPLEDDTLLVYAVDNGWAPSPDGPPAARGAHTAKRAPSEDGVRGPLILYWKGRVFDERSVQRKLGDTALASTADLLPTLLSLVGAERHRPALAQGIDLLNQRRGEVFGDTYELEIPVVSEQGFVYDRREASRTSRWLIDGRHKLILPDSDHFGGRARLYDVVVDPFEQTDLAEQQTERVARMSSRLAAWWEASLPRYLYAHEFRARQGSVGLVGARPDISRGDARWSTSGAVAVDGALEDEAVASLPFTPERGKRYELRAGGRALRFGFLDAESAPVGSDPAAPEGDGWVRRPEPGAGAASLVLDTAGAGWRLELRIGGMLRAERHFPGAAPDIRAIAIASDGADARVDFVQLIETPRFESLALRRGDTDGDGLVDWADLRTIADHYTGDQESRPSAPKTLREGDVDGDGDVDVSDAYQAVATIARSLF
jgi:uncharacterized sulfatase